MGRSPCCDKIGLRKGPWSAEEDIILVSYIQRYGHGNWRTLPKQAGLLRCGKSCRLRWTNYLRSDIKRGNFSVEEENTIISLHQTLGNRWSAIAARLPGRTDNEIKNVWHTYLKKRLNPKPKPEEQKSDETQELSSEFSFTGTDSSAITAEQNNDVMMGKENFFGLDGDFWSEELSSETNSDTTELLNLQDDYGMEFFLKVMEEI